MTKLINFEGTVEELYGKWILFEGMPWRITRTRGYIVFITQQGLPNKFGVVDSNHGRNTRMVEAYTIADCEIIPDVHKYAREAGLDHVERVNHTIPW